MLLGVIVCAFAHWFLSVAGTLEQVASKPALSSFASAIVSLWLILAQYALKSRLIKQLSVSQTNVAPHFRVATCNAGKVSKSASGKAEQLLRHWGEMANIIHQSKCQANGVGGSQRQK